MLVATRLTGSVVPSRMVPLSFSVCLSAEPMEVDYMVMSLCAGVPSRPFATVRRMSVVRRGSCRCTVLSQLYRWRVVFVTCPLLLCGVGRSEMSARSIISVRIRTRNHLPCMCGCVGVAVECNAVVCVCVARV